MIGTTVAHYRIVEKIGEGGMGEVFLAEDTSLPRRVALKFLPADLQEDETARRRFLREAESAAALEHPYICNIKEVNRTEEGHDFIVMEYVEGLTLKEKLREKGPLPVEEALRMAREIADALEMAHAKGLVHRDLKPSNIMLTPQGHAKVMDFGLAKRVMRRDGTEQDLTVGVTRDGSSPGTPAYMSPEQLRAEVVDQRSDLFSMGIVLYEALTGLHPFRRPTTAGTMAAILTDDPEPLGSSVPGSSLALQGILDDLLRKDPAERLPNVRELSTRLNELDSKPGAPYVVQLLKGRSGRRLLLSAAALVVMAFVAFQSLQPSLHGGGPLLSSVGILPFTNLSGDPQQEYFVAGMADELRTSLSKIAALTVISPSSMARYADGQTPLAEIGRDLRVEGLIEGSVLREGNRVRVSASLIEAQTGRTLWAESYERNLTSVMALQGEVARTIAGQVQVTLTPEEEARLTYNEEVDPQAYDAYLQGSFSWKSLTPEGLDTAERYFRLAIREDSTFAPAYSGLAWVWACRNQIRLAPREVTVAEATAAAARAFELDPSSAEAHEAMALVLSWHTWEWEEAWPHWRRALEVNPNSANTNAYYAHFLAIMGRPEEAVPFSERALELDPFNALFHGLYAVVLYINRRYDDALAAWTEARSIDPGMPLSGLMREYVYMAKGMREEQLAHHRERISDDPEQAAAFDRGLAEGGYEGSQLSVAEYMTGRREREGSRAAQARFLGYTYLKGGDLDKAMGWFEIAVAERDPNMPYLGMPFYDPLRSDPRFVELFRKMNLPEEAIARYTDSGTLD